MQLNELGELTRDQLLKVTTAISSAAISYARRKAYYEAKNPQLLEAPAKKAPDNRVPGAFGGKIVDTMAGFMFRAGNITYSAEDAALQKTIEDTFNANDEELHTAEIGKDLLVNGKGFEILRMDEDGAGVRLYRCEPGTALPVYDDTLARNMIAFVHLVSYSDYDDTPTYVRTTYYKNKHVTETSSSIAFEEDKTEREEKAHPFGEVNAVVYQCGMDALPIFEKVIPLIDEHDKIISSGYADERERFASAYLLLLRKLQRTLDDKGKSDIDKLAEIRIMDDLGSDGEIKSAADGAAFLTKPSRGPDTAESADRIERLIYDLAQVVNPNDISAGTAVAGIAYKLKIMSMEFKAADIETYVSRALQRRIRLIGNAKNVPEEKIRDVTIDFKRNIPTDIDALADTAGKLVGIVSKETILRMFPTTVIPNVTAELKKLEEETALMLPAFEEESEEGGEAQAQ